LVPKQKKGLYKKRTGKGQISLQETAGRKKNKDAGFILRSVIREAERETYSM
jgi:hypothetical protein